MQTVKISELTAPTHLSASDEFPLVQAGATKKGTLGKALAFLPVSTVTAGEVLAPARAGTMLRVNAATDQTFTIAPEATAGWPDGAVLGLRQIGAGHILIAGTGVTLLPTSASSYGSMSEVFLHRIGVDTWDVTGDLA